MKRFVYLLLLSLVSLIHTQQAAAQEGAVTKLPPRSDHAPRAYGLTVGGAYGFLSRLPLRENGRTHRPSGVQVAVRFGWQVRGLLGGAPATIGFESDFLAQPSTVARSSYALVYGVFAKHSFSSRLRVRPYFSYGLGAAQVWVAEVGGRGIGHATRIAFGVDTRIREQWHISVAITYQGILMPSFALSDRPARDTSFHGCVLSTGVWFGS